MENSGHEECVLDGVRYARVLQGGQQWRVGAVTPSWRQELLSLPADPDASSLARLEERGLWIVPENKPAPPLAVMCCGLGAVWPGMGRELYDTVPLAREAMDRLAAVADWDILGLMDETDVAKISHTRWQCPYLFLLEYAQWHVFTQLGLRPSIICGHSLGELIGLCLAGIYTPEVAWYILDTRAVHMAELEASATAETGMMAVHADAAVIQEAQAVWPELYVSNYNTPHQYILSGPRHVLLEARKQLRKRRIAAMMLPMNLAFHHPGMRVLRDMSLRRLQALDMRAPHIPMLSCVTTRLYPDDQKSICTHIGDLDENAVRWTECVETLWADHGIRTFFELGPQDTLCSLVRENRQEALCFTASRKGRETEALRQACARLYALGHLSRETIASRAHTQRHEHTAGTSLPIPAPHVSPLPPDGAALCPLAEDRPVATTERTATTGTEFQDCLAVVTEALGQACGRPASTLRPDMDLRYDLALRSSAFPLLVQDMEKALGRAVPLEHLLQVSTVGDLARVLMGGSAERTAATPRKARSAESWQLPPLTRYAALDVLPTVGSVSSLLPLALDPCGRGLPLDATSVILVWTAEGCLLPWFLRGIASLGCAFAVPDTCVPFCTPLKDMDARLLPLPLSSTVTEAVRDVGTVMRTVMESYGHVDGLLMLPSALGEEDKPDLADTVPNEDSMADLTRQLAAAAMPYGLRFVCVCALMPPKGTKCVFTGPLTQSLRCLPSRLLIRHIRLLYSGERTDQDAWGDMLARELLCGTERQVLWARPGALQDTVRAPFPLPRQRCRERFNVFPLLSMDPHPPYEATDALFQTSCHFSRFADPFLETHGGDATATPEQRVPHLPLCRALEALWEGARLALPWLTPTGFCDVRFHTLPLLPYGVTRECRLATEAVPWLRQDNVMTRLCRGRLSVRDLTPSGRRSEDYTPVVEGMTWLAAHTQLVPPLWPHTPTKQSDHSGDVDTEAFFSLSGLGSPWQLVQTFVHLPEARFFAILPLPETRIAPERDYGYTTLLLVVEGLVQAATLALVPPVGQAATKPSAPLWRLHGIGFLRFGTALPSGEVRIYLRRSWLDERRQRFDGQAVDRHDQIFLTAHHVEFVRCDAPPSSPVAVA